ncbi:hypothetical protein EJ02DRAFT_19105 [Clathrospora elynae]|uniref:ABM domain-containing protein n=1 Tax=Clathrospora elynae TaxID=706981 RepID=A0A6A5SDA2_9PLEO|nr:hypothetical protein EJ02DRAFT_19105 [Clathrospora elynae]
MTMSDQVTEIAYLPLKAGLDLESGDAKSAWEDAIGTIVKQPGFKAFFWGKQIENPDIVQIVVDWESIDAHQTFIKSPSYRPFFDNLNQKILAGPPTLFHVKFPVLESGADSPFTMPVTECVSAFFSPEHSEPEYSEQFTAFRTHGIKIPDVEARGMIGGWSVEGHTYEDAEKGSEVDGKMFAAFIGWPSVDSHLSFRKTEEFKGIVGYLRDGTKGVRVWHVAFQQYNK